MVAQWSGDGTLSEIELTSKVKLNLIWSMSNPAGLIPGGAVLIPPGGYIMEGNVP